MMWLGIYYLFNVEVAVCLLLISLGYMPHFVLKQAKRVITNLHIPKSTEVGTAIIVLLIALFVESVRKGAKHATADSEDFKERMMNQNKRLRNERNSYMAFGCLFLFLLITQIWVLLKKLMTLEDEKEKHDKIHGALLKQVNNKDAQAGLVEVAKGLDKVAKEEASGAVSAEQLGRENKRLKEQVEKLQEEKRMLQAQLTVIDAKGAEGGSELRKRGGAAAKDD